ncbi:hypothetical protein CWI38_0186p0040 [Hamiltosporidium tvaerminnensis]|uniref:Uncharacterized protein n=1 Tax=Hamiltosporidium tvaerminnensis TaxID=1176355 RepID=A0A4V2JY63_9MICR|nr:hypothetical protein CWI38_0186p0040 [Hamiltosporidium tvaerminnensis]
MKIESKEEIEKKRKSLAEQNPIFFIRLRRLVKIIFYTILINHVLGFLIQICFDINKTLSTQIRTIINFLLSNFYCLIVFYKKRANENRDYTYFCVNNTNGVLMNLFSIILSNVNDILKEKMFHINRTVGYVEYFFMLTFLFVINSCVVYNSFLMIKFIENNLTKYPANICLTHLISAFLLFVGEKLIIMAVFIVARFIVSDTPSILQTENRREFDNNTVKDLSRIRPDLKMVRKKAQDSQSQSYVEGATKELRVGLKSFLSLDVLPKINSEEDLKVYEYIRTIYNPLNNSKKKRENIVY